jgi:hypothetical protein
MFTWLHGTVRCWRGQFSFRGCLTTSVVLCSAFAYKSAIRVDVFAHQWSAKHIARCCCTIAVRAN